MVHKQWIRTEQWGYEKEHLERIFLKLSGHFMKKEKKKDTMLIKMPKKKRNKTILKMPNKKKLNSTLTKLK